MKRPGAQVPGGEAGSGPARAGQGRAQPRAQPRSSELQGGEGRADGGACFPRGHWTGGFPFQCASSKHYCASEVEQEENAPSGVP